MDLLSCYSTVYHVGQKTTAALLKVEFRTRPHPSEWCNSRYLSVHSSQETAAMTSRIEVWPRVQYTSECECMKGAAASMCFTLSDYTSREIILVECSALYCQLVNLSLALGFVSVVCETACAVLPPFDVFNCPPSSFLDSQNISFGNLLYRADLSKAPNKCHSGKWQWRSDYRETIYLIDFFQLICIMAICFF